MPFRLASLRVMKKVALVGFGFMGGMHAQVYRQLPDVQLAGIVHRDPERSSAKLARLGIDAQIFPDLPSLLESVEVDLVDICLPTDLHAPAALAAIRAGKHVFCEKPLAPDYATCLEMVRAARERGVFLMAAQCLRFWPEYQAFEEFLSSGQAGTLRTFTLQRRAARPGYSSGNWLHDGARSGGAALDLHIHDTDYVLHLLGLPEAVTSFGTRDEGGWSHIFTRYHYDGRTVLAEGGWDYPPRWGFQMGFQAVFENGSVEYDSNASPALRATVGDSEPTPLPFTAPAAGSSAIGEGNVSSLGGYFNELRYFIDCLNSGQPPAVATGEQAAESVRVVLAEIESAETGKTVRLPAG
jgi:predicted dehydrogenase